MPGDALGGGQDMRPPLAPVEMGPHLFLIARACKTLTLHAQA